MHIVLAVISGPHQGQTFQFEGHDTFIVGRSKRAHFRLPQKDEYFSRIHFMIEVNPPQCRLMDMNSSNGTYVNGQKITTIDLHDGDQIQAGHTTLQVTVADDDSEPPTRHFDPPTDPRDMPTILPQNVVALTTPATVEYTPQPSNANICRVCQTPTTTTAHDIPLCPPCQEQIANQNQPIPTYTLIRELGRGGMGVVYLALDPTHDLVALKTILPAVAADPILVERFLREADILRQLQHRYIVTFREMGEANGMLYFAMDYVDGTDANQLVKHDGPLEVPRAVRLTCQLLEALEFAHEHKFVHRDIKPANLLLTEINGEEEGRLADFGLARVYQSSQLSGLTMTGEIGGTVAFMAPEQIDNYHESPPSVDQYAAAATLYYLLTGQFVHDFKGLPMDHLLTILLQKQVPIRNRRSDLPEGLATVIDKALSSWPEDRFANVEELRQALLGVGL